MFSASEIAHLPDGNDMEYMDTGPVPNSSSYKTLVLIHGSGFNGHVYDKLLPLAVSRDLRLIVLHRRDYSKSTRYTPEELDDLSKGDIKFFDRCTVLLGHFIHYIIQKCDIPAPDSERKKGGIAVLGWSMASATLLTLLSDANLFAPGQYDILQRYLTDFIFYDPPHVAFGVHSPEGREPKPPKPGSESPEEYYKNFNSWVSSYYDLAEDWDGSPDELDYRSVGSCPTLDTWSQEEWDTTLDAEAAVRSEFLYYENQIQDALRKLVARSWFNEQCAKRTFPNVRLIYIVCWRAPWHTPWGFHGVREMIKQRRARNEFARPMRFEIVKEGNHFWHYDYPENFLTSIAKWTGFREE